MKVWFRIMHNIKILFFAIFCLLIVNVAGAEEKVLTLGGKNGWSKIQKMEGTVIAPGRYGFDSITLDTNSRSLTRYTDLLLDFEEEDFADCAGNYQIKENDSLRSAKAKMGSGSALMRGNGGIRLRGETKALFGSSGDTGSFLVEFWLCPSIAENGEIVFSWRSSRTVKNYPLYQLISATFQSNKLMWKFVNVFNGYSENNGTVEISSLRTIIPEVWMHHSIAFDEETGLLEYRIDGRLEALLYVTTNGMESGGAVYNPILGVSADLDICPKYTGLIDDFRIQRTSESSTAADLRYDAFKKEGGRFTTSPILISRGAKLNRIDAVVTEPSQTDVVFYVRSGDNYFQWTETYPEWIPVTNHAPVTDVEGMYFQIAVDLFPDGGGEHSPSVTELAINYTEVPLPLPPFTLIAEPGDQKVTLTWSYSVDNQAGGYYVFYGERPGEYLGVEAVQGVSPVDAGNVAKITLNGLKNGKIYYFAVASYSKVDGRIIGTLSKEVYARPLKR